MADLDVMLAEDYLLQRRLSCETNDSTLNSLRNASHVTSRCKSVYNTRGRRAAVGPIYHLE